MKKQNKKAQLQIQEMAFMLVAVIFFFVLVGLFVASIMYSNLHEDATQIAETRTLTSVTNLADSPEFSCVLSKTNCVDGDKAISLVNKTIYENFWPFSSLRIVRFNAFNKDENDMIQCTRANYANCGSSRMNILGSSGNQGSGSSTNSYENSYDTNGISSGVSSTKTCEVKWKYIKSTDARGGSSYVNHVDQMKNLYLSSNGNKYILSSSNDLRTSLTRNTVYTNNFNLDLSNPELMIDNYCQQYNTRYTCPGDRDCKKSSPTLVSDSDLGSGNVYELILNNVDGGENIWINTFRYSINCKEDETGTSDYENEEITTETGGNTPGISSMGNIPQCDYNCDVMTIYDKDVANERAISSYVVLCRKEYENGYTYDKCELARLVAGTELKPILTK